MALFLRVAVTKAATSGDSGQTHVDTEDLERAKRDLKNLADEMPHVAVRALNKAMTGTKTDMKNIVRADYNYKAALLDSRISVWKANRTNIQGHIQSKGGIVHHSDIATTSQTQRGVVVNIKKSTGRGLIPRTFQAPGRSSSKLITFRRPGNPSGQYVVLHNIKPKDLNVAGLTGGGYGPTGTGGYEDKKGKRSHIAWFAAPHPEHVYNAPHNWAKIADASAKRIDDNIAREIDAEFRKQEGIWG